MEIEVSLKVRSAIKAKLLELGVHVDDELPDYIMVLVANRRTKPQMESDLELFLSENTQKFTAWLFHVLKKLEQVTLADSIAVLASKDKSSAGSADSATQPKTKETAKGSQDKHTKVKASESSHSSSKEKDSGRRASKSSKGSDKSPSKNSARRDSEKSASGKSSSSKPDKQKKNTAVEAKGDKKEKDIKATSKPVSSTTTTATTKSAEKSNESKVQFKLKNNLVKQTEFDRKQAEAEAGGRKVDKSGTDVSDENIRTEGEENDAAAQDQEDILNLGDDEGEEDLFGVGEPILDEARVSVDTNSLSKKADADDDDDVEKLRKIALQTSSSRRKLGSGNVTALRGMVLNFEKENSNKRKRQSDESETRRSRTHSSHSKSEVSKGSEPGSPPRKLRSVVSVSTANKTSEEYDPEQPKIHKLSSVVHVTGGQRPKRDTTSMNSNLILKAMKAVEIDNIKRPMKETGSKKHRDSSESEDRNRTWRIARSPRSRSRDRNRRHDRDHRDDHRGVRRNSTRERSSSHRVRRDSGRSRSRSPLQLFTKRGRMSIRDRLGEKQVSMEPPAPSDREVSFDDEEDYLFNEAYLKEIRDMENDLNIIINVPNLSDNFNEDAKLDNESEKQNEASQKPREEKQKNLDTESMESGNKKSGKGFVAPNRISIQVMNSSDESDSDEENNERKVVVQQESESEAELEVSVQHDQDIDDLLPPQQQTEETSRDKEEKKTTEEKPDRLTDLRAKLAAITRTNTASYSPLHLQPTRPPVPVPPPLPVAPMRPSVPYSASYFYDSLPAMPFQPISAPTTVCKFWPTCSYGENCKYTHPVCKFGLACHKRPNCAFKHENEAFPVHAPPVYKPPAPYIPPLAPTKKMCHFFPKCNSMDCSFYHPKPCRYGVNCVDPNCIHYHPGTGSIGEKKSGKLPALHQLKWRKNKADGPSDIPQTSSTVT